MNQFKCPNKCMPNTYVCDKDNDCGDDSDEKNCERWMCNEEQFKCKNNRCIRRLFLCDGADDCGDNSDETFCCK